MATKTKKMLSKGSSKNMEKKNQEVPIPTLSLKTLSFMSILTYIRYYFSHLNNSKYFIGLVILIMNVGSRYVTIKLSKTHEQLIKNLITKDLLIFSILFISLRDILLAFLFTAVFKILSDYVFNEKSKFCMVPKKYQKVYDVIDENKDGVISESEIEKALETLNKAQKDKAIDHHKNAMMVFNSTVLK